MDASGQTAPLEETQQPVTNPQLLQNPPQKKLNWKGFFVGIIIFIIIEISAVYALKNDNKHIIPFSPRTVPTKMQTIKPPSQKGKIIEMAGKFIWNVPANGISANVTKEIKTAFTTYNHPVSDTSTTNHLSVDAIKISTKSANFALAGITYRDEKNHIIPTDGMAYYLQKENGQWKIIANGDQDFCLRLKIFPKDLVDDNLTSYYHCDE